MSAWRIIPSIEILLTRPRLADAATRHGRDVVTRATRQAAEALRAHIARGDESLPSSEAEAIAWIERHAGAQILSELRPSLRPVINATGVILHTNLGRAPLAAAACEQATVIAAGYSNLEYDLDAGSRGHRDAHAAHLLCSLTGAEAALVANNNAAATLLILAALARGREVIVSRGELVEIGGGFRVPDVMAQSGAVLREVGTTNRTRLSDYAAAIGEKTALILRVHPSNFTMAGFTERPALADLVPLAHRFGLPVFEDLGSGWLGLDDDDAAAALGEEPSVAASVRAGTDVVSFSGDKLLGGPQAGIVVGRRNLIDDLARHPMMRAFRASKLTYAALEATLALWAQRPARARIPLHAMLTMTVAAIDARATGVAALLQQRPDISAEVVDGFSTIGGGSAPGSALPTRLVAIAVTGISANAVDAALRAGDPAIVARIHAERVVLDLRTVQATDDNALAQAVWTAAERARAGR